METWIWSAFPMEFGFQLLPASTFPIFLLLWSRTYSYLFLFQRWAQFISQFGSWVSQELGNGSTALDAVSPIS